MFSVLHGHLLLQILELLVNLSTKNWKVPNHRAHNNITRNQSSRRWNVDTASIQRHWQKGGATRRTCLRRSRSSLHERLNSLSNSSMAGKTAARGWCGRGVILLQYSGSCSSSSGITYSHHDFVDMLLIIHQGKHKTGSISIYLGKKFRKEVLQICCPIQPMKYRETSNASSFGSQE